MFAVVNGYPCTSSCDVAVARRNVDPRNPRNDPVKAELLAEADLAKGKQPRDPPKVSATQDAAESSFDPKRFVDRYA